MLALQDVHVSYGSIAAVRGVSLRVAEGEVVALIGHNGAGKTTTLNAIMGLLKPSKGEIEFEGIRIARQSPERIARRGISIVPENRRIFARLSVRENLRIGATMQTGRSAIDAQIREMVERFPVLDRYFDAPAGRLSGGEQQQLAIARALLARPRLLLLDEPSLGLSPVMVDRVFETLAELRDEGLTILLVEQAVKRAMELSDRVYVMRAGGQIVLEGTAPELEALDLEQSYLGLRADVVAADESEEA